MLAAFEDRAGRWIATYRRLAGTEGQSGPLKTSLALTEKSSYEDARAAGEALSGNWLLGDVPALSLEARLGERLGALVLYVDAPACISGAACQLPGLATILVNRREPEGRRHYDLAHETFHLLTWEQMPPAHTEGPVPRGGKGNRVEQLADNFASALLMPQQVLRPLWEARGDIHTWLNKTATRLQVTAVALKWRLVQLEWLSKSDLSGIDDARLKANGRPRERQLLPKRYSSPFMERIHVALHAGTLSARRAACLLDLTIDGLVELLREHGLEAPIDL